MNNDRSSAEKREPVKDKPRTYRRSVFEMESWPTWGKDSDTAYERQKDREEGEKQDKE